MADRTLRYVLSATDHGAGKTIGDVAGKGTKAASSIGSAFGKLGQVIGGEVGELSTKVQEAFSGIEEHAGHGLAKKLEVAGAAILGVGGALTAMGDKDRQAQQQLDNAIENTGHHAGDFREEIDKTIGSMEKYGYTASHTQNALQTLVSATHDPKRALDLMGEAANLAAAKHQSLETASTQLARVLGGKGARTLAQYNIDLVKNADGTTNWAATNEKLAAILSGQADASVSGFTGKLKELRAEITDQVAEFGMKYGPAITAAGATMMLLTPVVKGAGSALSGLAGKFRASGAAATAAADETAAADAEIAGANEAAAASTTGVRTGALGAAAGVGALTLGIGALVVGGFALSSSIDGTNSEFAKMETSLKDTTSAVGALQTKLVNSTGSVSGIGEAWVRQAVQGTGLAEAAAKVGLTVDQVTAAVTGNNAQMNQLIATWQKSGAITGPQYAQLIRLSNGYRAATKSAQEHRAETVKQVQALNPLAARLGITNSQLGIAQKAADKAAASEKQQTLQMQLENNAAGLLSAGLAKLNGRTLDVEQANIAFRNSEAAVTDSVKTNGKSLSDNTAKGRQNRSAILDSISAAQQHAQAVATQTGSVAKATQSYETDIGALKRHLIQLGLDRGQVNSLIHTYSRIPHLKVTRIDIKDYATSNLRSILNYLNELKSGVTVPVRAKGAFSYTPGAATGGLGSAGGSDYFRGGRTLIAEREPEIVELPRGSRITPISKVPRVREVSATRVDNSDVVDALSRLERAIARMADRPVYLDGHKVGAVMGGQADRYLRGG